MRQDRAIPKDRSTSTFVAAVLLVGLALAAYGPALVGTLLWDDDQYVTKTDLRSWHGLWRIWTELGATPQYYPLTYSGFWLQHKLWGETWIAYHALNVLLHALNAYLVWRILARLRVAGALFAAAVFAVHPVQVESVAWITELKNTLSGAGYLGALLCYLKFRPPDDVDSGPGGDRRVYFGALLLFLCAVLAKSVTASLPAVVLLIAWWKRGRIDVRHDVLPLVPFFAVALILGAVTVWMEVHIVGAKGGAYELGAIERVMLSGRVIWFYVAKLVWPTNLAFIYPRWDVDASIAWQYTFTFGALLLLATLWLMRERIGRGPLTGALFFVGTLFPVLGFVNVFPFVYSFVADHFQYLACLGPIGAFAAFGAHAIDKVGDGGRIVRWAAACVVVLILAMMSRRQSFAYRDMETLWRDTLEKNPRCWMAYSNLGVLHSEKGELDPAVDCFRKALSIEPDLVDVHYNLGNVRARQGRAADAIASFERAIEIAPDHFKSHNNQGHVLFTEGRLAEAIAKFQRAIEIEPAYAQAHYNLGRAYVATGDLSGAIEQYRRAIEIHPPYADAHNNLGTALARQGDFAAAIVHFERALTLQPCFAEAFNNLGQAHLESGEVELAIRAFENALRCRPDYAGARANLDRARAAATPRAPR